MFSHEIYRDIFERIDSALWDIATLGMSREYRVKRIDTETEWAKMIIAAYLDEKAAMMKRIILEDRFSRIPMPAARSRQGQQNADPLLQRLVDAAFRGDYNTK